MGATIDPILLPPLAADDQAGVVSTSHVRELHPVAAAFRSVRLFAELTESERDQLAQVATLVDHPRRSYLFHGGDPGQTLLVVIAGVVEVRIERAGAHPVALGTFERGEFFGEMSFFDGQPRSAAAIALVDCQILSIARDTLPKSLLAGIAAGIMAELAKRVRRTDHTLTQLTDDISRAAHINGHTAAAVELEAVKTLYRRTEAIATETLERAERRASEVMERAGSLSDEVRAHVERAWSLLKRRVAPLAFVVGGALTWFGIDSVKGVQEKLAEVDRLHEEVKTKTAAVASLLDDSKTMVDQLTTAYRRVHTLEETLGELQAVREAVGLGQDPVDPKSLRHAALNYERAKNEVRARYFAATGDRPRFENFPPAVVFDAVDTYVALVMGGRDDPELALSLTERRELLQALRYVLSGLSDVSDANEPGHAALLLDARVREMLVFVAAGANAGQRDELQNELSAALLRARDNRARDNLALSLAALDYRNAGAIHHLTDMLESNQPRRAVAAALGLALLGERSGPSFLHWALAQDDEFAYAAAVQLTEAGADHLAQLSELSRTSDTTPDSAAATLQRWREAIDRALTRHVPQNCLDERYTRYLSACLLHGACQALPPPEDGSVCPSFSARGH